MIAQIQSESLIQKLHREAWHYQFAQGQALHLKGPFSVFYIIPTAANHEEPSNHSQHTIHAQMSLIEGSWSRLAMPL